MLGRQELEAVSGNNFHLKQRDEDWELETVGFWGQSVGLEMGRFKVSSHLCSTLNKCTALLL